MRASWLSFILEASEGQLNKVDKYKTSLFFLVPWQVRGTSYLRWCESIVENEALISNAVFWLSNLILSLV